MITAIETDKEFFFNTGNMGFIRTELKFVIIRPKEQVYELQLVHYCFKKEKQTLETPEGSREVENETIIAEYKRPLLSYSYDKMKMLSKVLNINRADFEDSVEYIEEMLRRGLLLTTQSECQQGILGVKGKGMYNTTAANWKITTK